MRSPHDTRKPFNEQIRIELDADRKQRIFAAAGERGMSVSAWLRDVADRAAAEQRGARA